jgi:thiamine kinase-like enzyme
MTTTGFWLIDWEWSGTAPILVDLTKACSPNFGRNHSEKDRNGEATFQLASHTIGDAMGVAKETANSHEYARKPVVPVRRNLGQLASVSL